VIRLGDVQCINASRPSRPVGARPCNVLFAAFSTFSMWASYLGGMPTSMPRESSSSAFKRNLASVEMDCGTRTDTARGDCTVLTQAESTTARRARFCWSSARSIGDHRICSVRMLGGAPSLMGCQSHAARERVRRMSSSVTQVRSLRRRSRPRVDPLATAARGVGLSIPWLADAAVDASARQRADRIERFDLIYFRRRPSSTSCSEQPETKIRRSLPGRFHDPWVKGMAPGPPARLEITGWRSRLTQYRPTAWSALPSRSGGLSRCRLTTSRCCDEVSGPTRLAGDRSHAVSPSGSRP